jgi:hypothetical protein
MEGTTCGNAFSTAQSAAAILTTSQWRELKTRTKMGRLAVGEEGGISTKLLGVARVVYEQNLVAVTAAGAPPILEPSRVSSCVRTLHKPISAHPKKITDREWKMHDKSGLGRRWCTGRAPSCAAGMVSSRDWSKAGRSSTAPPPLARATAAVAFLGGRC